VNDIVLDGLRLCIRGSIGVREHSLANGVMFYLSLLEDEIDRRYQTFLARPEVTFDRIGRVETQDLQTAASWLELTDALIVWCHDTVVVVRGGGCSFPMYWKLEDACLYVSTRLPIQEAGALSRSGLITSMVSVCLQGSYEPNACTETSMDAWRRLRRATVTYFFSAERLVEHQVDPIILYDTSAIDEELVSNNVEKAFDAYAASQSHVTSSVLELSGGFDSTLAGAAALHEQNSMRGISVEFPYYEFRFESDVQRAVASDFGIERVTLYGEQLLPYTTCGNMPQFDEPAVFVTGIRHADQVASFAKKCNATRIYTGHGGDQLFSTDLISDERVAHTPDRKLYSRMAWKTVKKSLRNIKNPAWHRRSTGCFVNDARQDVWAKESYGVNMRTPFADLAVFQAALLWSELNNSRGMNPDKSMLAYSLGEMLPNAVKERRGKVAYDGVWMRAYTAQHEHLVNTFDRCAEVLDYIGVSSVWLRRRADALAEWKTESDRDLLAGYSLATWLITWGIENVRDVAWAE